MRFDFEHEKQGIFRDFPDLRDNLYILTHAPKQQDRDSLFKAALAARGSLSEQDEQCLNGILEDAQAGRATSAGFSPRDKTHQGFTVITAGKPDETVPIDDSLYGFFNHFGLTPPKELTPLMITQSKLDHELGHALTISRLKTTFNTVSMGVRISMPLKQERAADAFSTLRHRSKRYRSDSRFPVILSDLRLMAVLLGALSGKYYTTPAIDFATSKHKVTKHTQADSLVSKTIASVKTVDEPEYTSTLAQDAGSRFHFAKFSRKIDHVTEAAYEMAQTNPHHLGPFANRVLAAVKRLAPGQYDPSTMKKAERFLSTKNER